jgi:hypothetical protein
MMSMMQAINSPTLPLLVSITLAENLPPVYQQCWRKFATGVNEAGGKFATGVCDTGVVWLQHYQIAYTLNCSKCSNLFPFELVH